MWFCCMIPFFFDGNSVKIFCSFFLPNRDNKVKKKKKENIMRLSMKKAKRRITLSKKMKRKFFIVAQSTIILFYLKKVFGFCFGLIHSNHNIIYWWWLPWLVDGRKTFLQFWRKKKWIIYFWLNRKFFTIFIKIFFQK
mgnify:CR=1 FL=1